MQQRVVWSGARLGSSSGQFRRPFLTKSALSVWFRALCEFDLWHFNLWTKLSRRQLLQATKSIFCSPSWTRACWGCEEKALYFPEYFEQFGASFGILCMSRSCWLRQDSLLCWMPNQAAASFFFGFFRFFAVLFGLAVFKFFFSCCCGERAGGDFTLNPVLSPEIWFCCLRCFFLLLWLLLLLLLFSLSVYLPSAC